MQNDESKVSGDGNLIDAIRKQINSYYGSQEEELCTLKEVNQELRGQLGNLEEINRKLRLQLQEYEKNDAKKDDEKKVLMRDIEECQVKNAHLEMELESLKKELSVRTAENKNLEEENKMLIATVSKQREEIKSQKKNYTDIINQKSKIIDVQKTQILKKNEFIEFASETTTTDDTELVDEIRIQLHSHYQCEIDKLTKTNEELHQKCKEFLELRQNAENRLRALTNHLITFDKWKFQDVDEVIEAGLRKMNKNNNDKFYNFHK